jgi:hypothetical protein
MLSLRGGDLSSFWKEKGRVTVLDVLFVAISLMFFAVSVGYVALCDRLARRQ